MTAPSPKVAESDSWAMLPTLATIIIASAGQAIMRDRDSGRGRAAGAASGAACLPCVPDFVGGWWRRAQPVVSVASMSATRSSYVDSSSGQ